jgi:hypothetical protein
MRPDVVIVIAPESQLTAGISQAVKRSGRIFEAVEIGWRRNLRVDWHPPTRRRQLPGRSRREAEYRQLVVFATADAGGYDPSEDRLRANVRATIEAMFEEELAGFLGRLRYGRGNERARGYRHGHRERQLTGTFGTETVRVPRARIENETGKISEWRSKTLPRYRRLTKKAEALITAVYLAGTHTRRVKRALFGLFEGPVGKDVVSRARAER